MNMIATEITIPNVKVSIIPVPIVISNASKVIVTPARAAQNGWSAWPVLLRWFAAPVIQTNRKVKSKIITGNAGTSCAVEISAVSIPEVKFG